MQEQITNRLKDHYKDKFTQFGPTSKGVDWGKDQDVLLRHQLMYNLIRHDHFNSNNGTVTLLDVGCGYGAFYEFLTAEGATIDYTGIDVVGDMIQYARDKHPSATFMEGDFLETEELAFDYVVCNGILTQKLSTSIIEMDQFANKLIKKMFSAARKGIAFNIMSTKVNFTVENLYYRHPADTLTFCLNELGSKVRLEHSYPLFEYTCYVYKS